MSTENTKLIYEEDTYKIIGACMKVHRELGHGFLEVVYKDALEIEFKQQGIPFNREVAYDIHYSGKPLPHNFFADFVVFEDIILEAKCSAALTDEHIAQTINYLKVSGCKVGLLVNFGRGKLEYKRLVY